MLCPVSILELVVGLEIELTRNTLSISVMMMT